MSEEIPGKMRETRGEDIPGNISFHHTISPEDVARHGPIAAIDDITAIARSEFITLVAIHSPKPVRFHIVVTTEHLTDSAGKPLETRDGDVGG